MTFYDKNIQQTRNRKKNFNIIKVIHENHTATENLSPKIRNKADACFANSI